MRLRRKVGDKEGEVGVLYDLAKSYEDLGEKDLARKAREEAASKEGTSGEAQEAVYTVERKNYSAEHKGWPLCTTSHQQ